MNRRYHVGFSSGAQKFTVLQGGHLCHRHQDPPSSNVRLIERQLKGGKKGRDQL